MARLIRNLIPGAGVLVLVSVMVIALGVPGSQAADSNLLTALEGTGEITDFQVPPCDLCPDTTPPPPPPPEPPLIPAVGGIAGLLEADDAPAATTSAGTGEIGYIVALAGVVGAALIAGGWYARRRWLA